MKTSATEPRTAVPVPEEARMPAAQRQARQRQGVRRTALIVGAVAVLIYAGFILSGVIGR